MPATNPPGADLAAPHQGSAVPKTNFQEVRGCFGRQKLERALVNSLRFGGHHPEEESTEHPTRMRRLFGDEIRTAQSAAYRAGR